VIADEHTGHGLLAGHHRNVPDIVLDDLDEFDSIHAQVNRATAVIQRGHRSGMDRRTAPTWPNAQRTQAASAWRPAAWHLRRQRRSAGVPAAVRTRADLADVDGPGNRALGCDAADEDQAGVVREVGRGLTWRK